MKINIYWIPNCGIYHQYVGSTILWKLVGCWSFTSLQHLRSCVDRCRFAIVYTLGEFIVLPQWKIRPTRSMILISHSVTLSWSYASQSLPCPNTKARLHKDKYQFYKSLVWLNWQPKFRSLTRENHSQTTWPPPPVWANLSVHHTQALSDYLAVDFKAAWYFLNQNTYQHLIPSKLDIR